MPKLTISAALANWESTRSADAKKAFHRVAKKALKEVVEFLNLPKSYYVISVCKGGPAVLGEVTLRTDRVYVSLSKSSYMRTCEGRKYYANGKNMPFPITSLEDTLRFTHDLCLSTQAYPTEMIVNLQKLRELPIDALATIVILTWESVSLHAAPYLNAMCKMRSVNDGYGADSGETVILYFLANATQYKGAVARMVKAELKARIK